MAYLSILKSDELLFKQMPNQENILKLDLLSGLRGNLAHRFQQSFGCIDSTCSLWSSKRTLLATKAVRYTSILQPAMVIHDQRQTCCTRLHYLFQCLSAEHALAWRMPLRCIRYADKKRV
jgi:hypothetical protein